jgi:hypothetical protein
MKYLPFILFTVLTNAAAQLMLKQGMLTLNGLVAPGPHRSQALSRGLQPVGSLPAW